MTRTRTVRVTVSGGVVQEVRCPRGVRVIVRDYDLEPGDNGERIRRDARGDHCHEAEYRHEAGPNRRP